MKAKNIHITDFTKYQKTVFQMLKDFVSSDNQVFLLKGYAGSGKTMMIKHFADYLHSENLSFSLSAPTGRAAKVIHNKTGYPSYTIHKTIYSMSEISFYESNKSDNDTFKYFFHIRSNDNSGQYIYIIDESSMISNTYSENEFFRFGSGYLLDDFIRYTQIGIVQDIKIVFVGDPAQLPPVNMNISPALDKDYLKKHFPGLRICDYVLEEIVRQEKESGIISNSEKIRNSIDKQYYSSIFINTDFDNLSEVTQKDLLGKYIDSCSDTINEKSIIIAQSNYSVNNYNKMVRSHFFPKKNHICIGDKVIIVQNNYSYDIEILNGDFALVTEVLNTQETRKIPLKNKKRDYNITLSFRDVVLQFTMPNGIRRNFKCKIIENLLDSSKPTLTSDEQKAMFIDFRIRNPYTKLGSPEFKQLLKSDSYFNAVRVKYGYAITGHKAQGGEWENAFVDFSTNTGIFNEYYFRWVYTAMTRANKNLYCMSAPKHRINEVSEIQTDVDLPCISNQTVVKLQVLIRQMVGGKGYFLDKIVDHQYCKRCFVRRRNQYIYFDCYYNKTGVITNICPLKSGPEDKVLAQLIKPLIGIKIFREHVPDSEIKISDKAEPLREFYISIRDKVKETSIRINNVVHYPYMERYTFSDNCCITTVNFYYNSKYRFTKFQPLNKNYVNSLYNKISCLMKETIKC